MGELVDLAEYRARRAGAVVPVDELEAIREERRAVDWTLDCEQPNERPCHHCRQEFTGLEIRVGAARFHARRGACRTYALALLNGHEQALAEEARRSKLWAIGPAARPEPQQVIALDARGVPMLAPDDRPVMVPAQCVFPPRRS